MAVEIPPDVKTLLDSLTSEQVAVDSAALIELMAEITAESPRLWPGNTVGFGGYHYRYASGQEGDFFDIGFAPRRDRLTIYVMSGLRGFEDILDRLGPHQVSKSTLHIKRLTDIDRDALTDLIRECSAHLRKVEKTLGAIPRMSEIPPRSVSGA